MNRKNSNAALIAVICAAVVIAFSVAAVMFAKGNNADSEDEFDGQGPIPESYVGRGELPADSHALQSPRNSDMSEDEAMADEYDFGVTMTYAIYSTNRVGGISQPTYRLTENCGSEPMDELGMQSDGILDEFSENPTIDMIEIWNTDESQLCDTVFIIDGEYLVYYGTGSYVFCAVRLDAVG